MAKALKKLSCDKRKDPVARKVRNCTARELVDWMIKYHGLPKESAGTVVSNLDEQFKWHNLQGRLEANKGLAAALDAFNNAAINQVLNSEQRTDLSVISAMSTGFAFVAAELRKGSA